MRHRLGGAPTGHVAPLTLGVALAAPLGALVLRAGRPHTAPASALRAGQAAVALAAVTARAQAEPNPTPSTANRPQPQNVLIVVQCPRRARPSRPSCLLVRGAKAYGT